TVTPEDLIEAEAASGGPQPVPTTPAGQTPPGAGAAPATDPRAIMQANACLACHKLGAEGGPIGPPFDGMGSRLSADRIRSGILMPNADTAQGYAAVAGTMPQTFGAQLTAAQLEALVTFLSGLK
ncbi:MAG: c-type cytochrome, partial [Longimicrobiales bacterium]